MRHHGADTTMVAVEGVVQTVSAEGQLLTLIDVREYQVCGLSDCCLYMPVKWSGEMPQIEESVIVRGSIQSGDSGLVFVATEVSGKIRSELQVP